VPIHDNGRGPKKGVVELALELSHSSISEINNHVVYTLFIVFLDEESQQLTAIRLLGKCFAYKVGKDFLDVMYKEYKVSWWHQCLAVSGK
jgi:hypothetical protein